MDPSRTEIERDVALGRSVHAALLERLHDLLAGDALDASAPSRLPGWNRAQVLTHLARNADGHRRMIEGAGRGEVLEQYEGGVEGRRVGIDAGAVRSAIDVVRDLAAATAALEAAWEVTDWQGAGRRGRRGETPIDRLAFLRCREVSLHGVDLDIGIELADLDPLYVRLELARMERLWAARRPTGSTRLPAPALALTPTDRVGWLTGRLDVHGLEPAGIF
jgi:maleylpyruvate isomerase